MNFVEKNMTDEVCSYIRDNGNKILLEDFHKGGFEYLKKHPKDTQSKYTFLNMRWKYFLNFLSNKTLLQAIDSYQIKFVAFRLYYMLTGLYFDTNFETQIYKGVGDGTFEEGFQFELIEKKLARRTYVRGVRYGRSKNVNTKSLEGKIERLCDLKERLKNMKVWFEEYAKSSSEVKDFALVKNTAFANLRKKLTFTNVCAPESLPEQSLQFTKDAQGKIEVKVLAEVFKQENIDSIEIEILRNLDAVEKMIEFYSLECVWIIPPQLLVFSTRRHVNQGSDERFVFPRKYPFDSSFF